MKEEIFDPRPGLDEKISEVEENIVKIKITIGKQFSKAQSLFILQIISKCMKGKVIRWKNVELFFESDGSNEEMLKKIKNHYYNGRSAPTRIRTKRDSIVLKGLGLDV
jgi:hypothetical protein